MPSKTKDEKEFLGTKLIFTGNGKIDLPEFINLMEKMAKPTEEHASTIEAYRVFDGEGAGHIQSKIIREIIIKSLDQVPVSEINDLLDCSGLLQDRNIYYDGEKTISLIYKEGLTQKRQKFNYHRGAALNNLLCCFFHKYLKKGRNLRKFLCRFTKISFR